MSKRNRKAQVARQNGAKSNGPKTEEGKAISSQNASKVEAREEHLSRFFPPHSAILCHEPHDQYAELVDELIYIYRPTNQVGLGIVRDMAGLRWQLDRLQRCLTMSWNHALIEAGKIQTTIAPELAEFQTEVRAIAALLSGPRMLTYLNREIDRLQASIARLERRLKFVNANFPNAAPAKPETTEENKGVNDTEKSETNEPIYITENTPAVIAAYQAEYPGREIIVLPPDNVAMGIETEGDDMPIAPRRAS